MKQKVFKSRLDSAIITLSNLMMIIGGMFMIDVAFESPATATLALSEFSIGTVMLVTGVCAACVPALSEGTESSLGQMVNTPG